MLWRDWTRFTYAELSIVELAFVEYIKSLGMLVNLALLIWKASWSGSWDLLILPFLRLSYNEFYIGLPMKTS